MPFGLLHFAGARLRNADGEVNLEGLWVVGANGDFCGGADATPVASLPGSSIQGARAGVRAAAFAVQAPAPEVDEVALQQLKVEALSPLYCGVQPGLEPDRVLQRVLEISFRHINILKNETGLKTALREFELMRVALPEVAATDAHQLKKVHDIRNMLQVAELGAQASLLRTESRQAHYRLDYPQRDDANWLKWIIIRRDGTEPRVWTEDVPLHKWKHRPPKGYGSRWEASQ